MKRLKSISVVSAALVLSLSFVAATSSVHADASTTSSKGLELAYVDQSGSVYLKSGNISGTYSKVWDSSDPATNVEVTHNAIAILDQAGNVYINSLPSLGSWTLVTSGVSTRNFGISDSYVYLFLSNTLYEKPLAQLTAGWTPFFSNVQGFEVSANGNLVAETVDNTLYEAYGGYGSQWTAIATNFNSYSVSDTEAAAVFGNTLYVMIGAPVNNAWRPAYSNASRVQLSPNGTIGVIDPAGSLDVAPGGYGSQWVNNVRSASDSTYTYVSDSVVTAENGGTVFAKLSGIYGGWSQIASNVIDYSIE